MADTLRWITLFLVLIACLSMPIAVMRRHQHVAGWLVAAVLILNFIGAAIAVSQRFGEPLVWYRTPRIAASALLALAYVVLVMVHPDDRHHP